MEVRLKGKIIIPNSVQITLSGQTSRGVKEVILDDNGNLSFVLTDGSTELLGNVMGPQGPKGDTGAKGEKGDRGEKGETGATGAKGDKGDPGATGPQGITPTIGENENWYLGNVDTGKPSRGRQGEKGEKGEKGETGAKGEKGDKGDTGATGPQGEQGAQGLQGERGEKGEKGDTGAKGDPGTDGTTPTIGANGNWYLGTTDTGKPSRGAKGDKGDQGETGATGAPGPQGATGPQGTAGHTPVKGTDYFTAADKSEIAQAAAELVSVPSASSTTPKAPGTASAGSESAYARGDHVHPRELPNVTAADNGKFLRVDSGAWAAAEGDASFDITGASTGQSPIINAVDADGKPTAWGAAVLAKADGSNIPNDAGVMDTWRTKIAALPGVKVYGKADANGKIMAYIDAACTKEVTYMEVMLLNDYGNALLIYDHKTYQCVGFEEPASMQGSGYYLVTVFFRSEIAADSSGAILKVETAKLNIQDYLVGEIDAPITITAGDLPLTTTTTT